VTTPSATDAAGERTSDPQDDAPPGMPLWVKLFGIVVIAALLVLGGLHLTGHGMGPGAHMTHLAGHTGS
jgi:hypothetical protein